ncbi:unannotated protein [freshwater metagenome]|uniref:Unannotated protein n=1 Tax=freshwater metagenome TaxID=449393 RepID=A0A6J6WQB2_9ZZZZ
MHRQKQMAHRAHRVGWRINRNLNGVFHVSLDKVGNLPIERCRKQHCLVHSSDMTHDPLDLGHKPLICHAVCFIDCHNLNRAQVTFRRLHEVNQAQRCRNNDLDTLLDLDDLLLPVGTAVHSQHSHTAMLANRPQHFRHLQREFARRHDHQTVRLAWRGRRINARHHRHTKRQSLARTRASPAHHVFASHGNGYRLGLNSKWCRESGGGEASIDALRHTNIGKSCWRFYFGGRHLSSHATNHPSHSAGLGRLLLRSPDEQSR